MTLLAKFNKLNKRERYTILLGIGMTFGELPNSFLKRQLEIPPGRKKKGPLGILFFVFDQVDLIIGIWIFLFPLFYLIT